MEKFIPGYLSSRLTLSAMLLFLALFLGLTGFLGYRSWHHSSAECVNCHSDKKLMEKLGAPYLYTTPEMVARQSRHQDVECQDCHLGNGRAKDKDKAHEGMLKALLVGESGSLLKREDFYHGPILPSGDNKINELLPKVEVDGEIGIPQAFRNLLWHDRDKKTYNFDPKIAEKTCSKSNCHPQELKQFSKTVMGINFRQRHMRSWTTPNGPHNCGPSFADLPAGKELTSAGLSFANTEEIRKNLNVPFSNAQAVEKQKFCNICHAGCLDCHYTPSVKEGVHSFNRVPSAASCSGYGRGTSICHPGAMQSRRGETYIGADYSVPPGMKPDVHYEKGINCVDCHPTGEKGMGDMERSADCRGCHLDIEKAHGTSLHKKLDCASCHIEELRGYQLTMWGPGKVSNEPNPFKKYSLYYGIQKPPLLVKDMNGIWRPYKIWPHSVGNIKESVSPAKGLEFKWPEGQTKDAIYTVGTFDGLPENNKQLLWVQFDQASHPYGKARQCDSCHAERQESRSEWEFYDDYGAEPFKGEHKIIADTKSLRIADLTNTTPITLLEGAKLTDFAAWLFLKDKWVVPGDFSIKADKEKYRQSLENATTLNVQIKALENMSGRFDAKTLKRLKTVKSVTLHNEETGKKELAGFTSELSPATD